MLASQVTLHPKTLSSALKQAQSEDELRRFLVIVEEGENNLSAYSPDLPGCIATGETYDETLQNMYEAIEFHLEALVEDG